MRYTFKSRWPLRYRLAHRAHCWVNKLHRSTGKHGVTEWLNKKMASLWVPWWLSIESEIYRKGKH